MIALKGYIIRCFIIALEVLPIYLVIRKPWQRKGRREILGLLFVIYLVCLLSFTLEGEYQSPQGMLQSGLMRIRTGDRIRLTPLRTICSFLRKPSGEAFWINIVGNVVVFIPWGFLLPCLWTRFRKPQLLIAMCLAITVCIEFLQLFIGRHTDIDDVILNFLGGILGGLLYWGTQRRNQT